MPREPVQRAIKILNYRSNVSQTSEIFSKNSLVNKRKRRTEVELDNIMNLSFKQGYLN